MGFLSFIGSIALFGFLMILFFVLHSVISIRNLLSRKPSARNEQQQETRKAKEFVQQKYDKEKAQDVEFEEL